MNSRYFFIFIKKMKAEFNVSRFSVGFIIIAVAIAIAILLFPFIMSGFNENTATPTGVIISPIIMIPLIFIAGIIITLLYLLYTKK